MSLVAVKTKKSLPALVTLADQAEEYACASQATNTRRAYESDLRSFATFCDAHGVDTLPATPQIAALYFANLASTGKAVSTIRRHAVSIAQAHKLAGLVNPVADPHVRKILQGIARTNGTASHQKSPLLIEHLRAVLKTLDTGGITPTLMGLRDRAILLLAFSCASRRSEIAALDVPDLRFESTGLVVTVRRSKTDKEGKGREIGVPYLPPSRADLCAARAVKAWIEASKLERGPLFRSFALAGYGMEQPLSDRRISGRAVAELVKRVTDRADLTGDFSGHSLRSGFVTQAAMTKGVSEVDIMRVSGHRSVTILRSYVRKASVLQDCPLSVMFAE
jgi:integrase